MYPVIRLNWLRVVLATSVVVALLATLAPGLAGANNHKPIVLPPTSEVHVLTYGEWSARWWKWAYSVPLDQNLLNPNSNGHPDCTAGQHGDVWFISGVVAFTPATYKVHRDCTIPEDVNLFYPLVNNQQDNVGVPPTHFSVADLRKHADVSFIPTSTLFATVDGVAITNLASYRAISPVFSYIVPPYPNNIYALFFLNPKWIIPGNAWPTTTVSPAVSDGYYLMLAPLALGQHTLTFGGGDPTIGFREEMTYTITVSCDVNAPDYRSNCNQ